MSQVRSGIPWTEEDVVKVLSLYCQLSFGQMHSRNPAVVRFARKLDRTPAAIALKLVNLASFDPELRNRGIRGMTNASRMDRAVWDRFHRNWSGLAAIKEAVRIVGTSWNRRQTSTRMMITVRKGQGFFRNAVLSAYEGACCITGIRVPALLRASHIIPWAKEESRRLDPANGICLNALHDAAFDAGLIGLDGELRVVLSRTLRNETSSEVYSEYFSRYEACSIRMPERFRPDPDCLEFHRKHVFVS